MSDFKDKEKSILRWGIGKYIKEYTKDCQTIII